MQLPEVSVQLKRDCKFNDFYNINLPVKIQIRLKLNILYKFSQVFEKKLTFFSKYFNMNSIY